jgi:hypothetical protein
MKKIILVLAILALLVPCVYAADADSTTLAEMRTTVRELLGGTVISAYWTNTMIDDFLNMGCREYASIAAIGVQDEDTIITSASETDYALNSNFIEKVGVVRLENGRKRTIYNRTTDPASPAELPFGTDNAASSGDHPRFYTIGHNDSGYFIRLDPVQGIDSTEVDTLLIAYKAYAAVLDTDTVVTDIPYQGRNFVIKMAFYYCLVAGRDQPGVGLILPSATNDYSEARNTVLNRYAPKYDQNWKPAQ